MGKRSVETLYLLGEGRRVRPPRARREKPRVSAFTSADVPKILDLKPELVLTFSDLQADIDADPTGDRSACLQSANCLANARCQLASRPAASSAPRTTSPVSSEP
jgi:hypothetical protein